MLPSPRAICLQRHELIVFQEVNARGEKVLCRTENFVESHEGFNRMLRSEKLLYLLEQLAGEPMILFKEKINYKLAGSGKSKHS
jgi:hypothetical protein